MRPEAPTALLAKAQQWERLSRWERSEIGRDLRRLGWTYGEIEELIPVPKGTLAHWCRDVILTEAQIAAIKRRRPPGVRTGIPIDTQRRRRLEVASLQAEARSSAALLRSDPAWVAGTVLYWAEGDKTEDAVHEQHRSARSSDSSSAGSGRSI